MLRPTLLVIIVASGCATDSTDVHDDAVVQLQTCTGPRTDAFASGDLRIAGDELVVRVQTGGGCARHTFSACWDDVVLDSAPPQAFLALAHDGHGDTCDALLTRDVRIDLSRFRTRAELPIVLHVTGGATLAGTTNSITFE